MTPGRVDLPPSGRAVVPFAVASNGYPVLTVKIPRGERRAALDLTQPFGSISAQSVGRQPSDASLNFLRFPTVQLGEAVLHDPSFLLEDIPENTLDAVGQRRLPAVLGVRLFQDVLLTIDGPNRQLVLEHGSLPPPDGADVLPFRTDMMGRPSVQVAVGKQKYWFALSTGTAPDLYIPDGRKRDFRTSDRTVREDQISLVAGPYYMQVARLSDDLVLGRHVLARPYPLFGDWNKPALGWGYLKHFAITIDQKNKRIRFTRAQQGPIVHRRMVPGFQMAQGTREVVSVFPGSGAERVGLRPGDIIRSIGAPQWADARPAGNETGPVAADGNLPVVVSRRGGMMPLLVPVKEALP
jgi:hypothetical protein